MRFPDPTRLTVTLVLLTGLPLSTTAFGQIGGTPRPKPSAMLPASPTTSVAAADTTTSTPQTPAQRPARRADVTFEGGQLAVKADNSSLNQILREIGHQTGIKITGGVADERVFGKYGPSAPSAVLAALLDGTASNVLLLQSDAASPGELILTPRQGGVTPPNPNAPGFDDEGSGDDAQQPQVQQPQIQQPVATPQINVPPASASFQPSAVPATSGDPSDPNAVKTPQQIYEQLQRLRQQQMPPQQ